MSSKEPLSWRLGDGGGGVERRRARIYALTLGVTVERRRAVPFVDLPPGVKRREADRVR